MDKATERRYLETAATLLGWPVRSVLTRERPDFCLRLADGSSCGLEVVEVVDEDAAAGWAAAKRLLGELEARLRESNPPLHVHLSFETGRSSLMASARSRRSHINALVQLVERRRPIEPGGRLAFKGSQLRAAGAPHADSMLLWPSDSLFVGYGGHGPGQSHGHLDRTISIKGAKVAAYRQNLPDVSQFWLLVVGNARAGSAFMAEVARRGSPRSAYDRVFYLDALVIVARVLGAAV